MKSYILSIVRIILGFIFLISSVSKFYSIQNFISIIKAFEFIPDSFVGSFAMIVIIAEFISGFLLLIGLWTKFSSIVVISLLILFITAIIPHIAMGSELECGCFGPLSEDKVDSMLLLRDIVLLGFTLIIFKQNTHFFSIDNVFKKRRS